MNIQGFIGPAYTSISRAINAQDCINLRLEVDLANGKTPLALVGLPGYRAVKEDLAGEVRGFWMAQSRVFAVVGSNLYEMNADLTHTLRGTLGTQYGPVSIADNGLQMLVVDGVGVLALTLETNATTNSIDNFPPGAQFIVCVDNTFIANEPGSQRFNISAVGDGLTWAAIDFASVEGLPDDLRSIVAFNRQLYMLGAESLQVFWNSGDSTRPFIPLEGSFAEIGIIAPWSAAKDETGVYWLGADSRGGPRVYKANGGQVRTVSTPAMSAEFSGSTGRAPYKLEDARAYTFRADDHTFYVLTFPTTSRTWVFDASTEGWSQFLEWDSQWSRHRSNCAIYAYGRQFIGDFYNGKIYEMASDIYANDGRVQRAVRASAHIAKDQQVFPVASIEAVTEGGVGLTTGNGKAPQMMLRVSKDGGNNWGREIWREMGVKGEFRGRVRWPAPCSSARELVVEMSITDPVKRVIVSGVLNAN